MPDLQTYAQQQLGNSFNPLSEDDGSGDLDALLPIAKDIRAQCSKLGLRILCLQPFSQFEGHTDDKKREAKFRKAEAWMKVMEAVGTDMLQVGSTDDRSTTSDRNVIVKDLQDLAELAAKRNMRIGYEVGFGDMRGGRSLTRTGRIGAGQHTTIHGKTFGKFAKQVRIFSYFVDMEIPANECRLSSRSTQLWTLPGHLSDHRTRVGRPDAAGWLAFRLLQHGRA
jgi:hypothetical protein